MAQLERVLDDACEELSTEEFNRVVDWFIGRYKAEEGRPEEPNRGNES